MNKTINGRFLVKLSVVLAILVLLFFAGRSAFNLALAGVYNHQTKEFLSFWKAEKNKKPDDFKLNPVNYRAALRGAEKGITLLPDSPEQWVLKARVQLWGLQHNLLGGDKGADSPLLITWQQAIALRPAWPYAWSDYAMARAQLSLIDDAFESALFKANQLGPWEKRVLINSATLGLHYKGWLSEALQNELTDSLRRLSTLYPRNALTLARKYDSVLLVCSWLDKPEKVKDCRDG